MRKFYFGTSCNATIKFFRSYLLFILSFHNDVSYHLKTRKNLLSHHYLIVQHLLQFFYLSKWYLAQQNLFFSFISSSSIKYTECNPLLFIFIKALCNFVFLFQKLTYKFFFKITIYKQCFLHFIITCVYLSLLPVKIIL